MQIDRIYQLHNILIKRRTPISLEALMDEMQCSRPSAPSSVTAFLREVLMPLFPESMHAEMEREIPTIGLQGALIGAGVGVLVTALIHARRLNTQQLDVQRSP